MKQWRKIVIFIMILVIPISSWASVMMTAHCQISANTSHSMPTQVNDGESIHVRDQMSSTQSNDQSNCVYGENINCSVSGCSTMALSNTIWSERIDSIHPLYQRVQSLADPSDPNLLLRPPIYLS